MELSVAMESVVIARCALELVLDTENAVQSTTGCLAGTRSTDELPPEIARSGNAIESTAATSLTARSRRYDEHFFEGVAYNPDAVESLALADISPIDFLSAGDLQLDDSGFWASSCEVTLASTSSGAAAERWTSDEGASPCFSNTSDETDSDVFNDWVDSFT